MAKRAFFQPPGGGLEMSRNDLVGFGGGRFETNWENGVFWMWMFPKKRGILPPKMDGEHNGKPY